MTKYRAIGCLWLIACDPVLLEVDAADEQGAHQRESPAGAAARANIAGDTHEASATGTMAAGGAGASGPNDQAVALLDVQLAIKSIDCGACFELSATVTGGVPPYRYEWDDGSTSPSRQVCVGSNGLKVWVVAEDQNRARSSVREADLQTDDTGSCMSDVTRSAVCLRNPSFEGTATVNTGGLFDAFPWSDCIDPASTESSNTPDIASNTLDPVTGIAPPPRHGITYLAMTAGEQASQPLCAVLTARSEAGLRLDAMRFDLGGPDMFLQIWGGRSASCAQRKLLWVSPPLNTTWENYCVTLESSEDTDLITLRADISMPDAMLPNYIAVDNLVPVDQCP